MYACVLILCSTRRRIFKVGNATHVVPLPTTLRALSHHNVVALLWCDDAGKEDPLILNANWIRFLLCGVISFCNLLSDFPLARLSSVHFFLNHRIMYKIHRNTRNLLPAGQYTSLLKFFDLFSSIFMPTCYNNSNRKFSSLLMLINSSVHPGITYTPHF